MIRTRIILIFIYFISECRGETFKQIFQSVIALQVVYFLELLPDYPGEGWTSVAFTPPPYYKFTQNDVRRSRVA